MTLQLLHFDEKNSKSTCQKEISFFFSFFVWKKKMHLKYLTTSEKKIRKNFGKPALLPLNLPNADYCLLKKNDITLITKFIAIITLIIIKLLPSIQTMINV